MKKLLILVVLAVLAVGFFVFKPEPITQSADSVYILAVLEPNVLVKQENQANFAEVSKSARVKAGDEIKTSSTGRASLLYPNGNVTNIDRDSHLKIKTLEENGDKSTLTLLVGGILAKVRNALGVGDYYQVETQNSVASVRGTIFAVKFKENISSVLVLENKVLVSAMDPKTGEAIKDHGAVEVESGEKVEVKSDRLPSADYPLEAKLLTKEDLAEEFIKRSLDQEDLKKESIRKIFEKVKESLPKEPVLMPTVLPRLTATPKPTATLSPTPLVLSPTPELIRETIKETLTLTPIPVLIQTSLISVTPKTLELSAERQEIVINGQKLTGTKQVFIGESAASFFVLDEATIFAALPSDLKAGVYDIVIVTSKGEKLRLDNALTVK